VEGEFFAVDDFSEIAFSEVEEWAENLERVASECEVGDGAHGGEAPRTGAAEKAEEEGFGLVVGVVGEGNVGCAAFEGGLAEETETFTAAGGFEGFAVECCAVGDIDRAGDERDAAWGAKGAEGVLIGVAFGNGAEAVIEVGGNEGVLAIGVEEVEECGGV
jgi:hypothetical protein